MIITCDAPGGIPSVGLKIQLAILYNISSSVTRSNDAAQNLPRPGKLRELDFLQRRKRHWMRKGWPLQVAMVGMRFSGPDL